MSLLLDAFVGTTAASSICISPSIIVTELKFVETSVTLINTSSLSQETKKNTTIKIAESNLLNIIVPSLI